ncbi:MAG TPA: LuxR C-terminal-related transcriptional regulator [Streptosporangiaceae bacterium]|nr:LuxR C-terminal-related transcriptional regulator [Streptosporangiaceae bacterium]
MEAGLQGAGLQGATAAEFSAFIGRDAELGELRSLASSARALTLCGAGGIGKTRLAVRLAKDLAPAYPDGAWFVELADLRQPELVASRIAMVIGVSEEPGRPLAATLADALRSRRMLICLDTCEHLIDSCAQVCHRLLASSPGLRMIATSREPLRVAAEIVWQVPPLSLSEPDSGLTTSDAVSLFADRAAAAKPGFTLTKANIDAVIGICRSLDGLPLAIELAAAWVRALSVEQIATRLGDRFRLLSSADRTAPARHRTLRAAIDWSHDLLSPAERILLRRLSVFADWPLEMAEAVCSDAGAGPGGGDELPAADVLDVLTGLADKSLVMTEHVGRGKIRYRMLDTIREYAAEQLEQAGEADELQRRFRWYAVSETEDLSRIGMARVPATWSVRVEAIHRFEADNANLRLVLGRALTDGDAEAGLRICVSMRPVWIIQGSFAEGANWTDAFLAIGEGVRESVLGAGLVGRAQLAMATDPDAARRFATEGLARLASDQAAPRRADESAFWAASALNLLAEVALHARDLDEATARADAALAVARPAGDRWNEGYAAGTLAAAAAFSGDLDQAKELAETALEIASEIDQQWGAARALMGLGDLARLTGHLDQARQRYEKALGILREISAKPEIARCQAGLGRIAMSQGDLALARRHLSASLELSQSTGSRIGVIRGIEAFAALATDLGEAPAAVRLAAAAAALRVRAGLPARTGRLATPDLGDDVTSELWAEGSALAGDEAVAVALSIGADARPARPAVQASAALTARELEIADLIAEGRGNKDIAGQLFVSPATAARHVANISAKLGVSSRAQIAAWVRARYEDRTGR